MGFIERIINYLAALFHWNTTMPSLDNNPEVPVEMPPEPPKTTNAEKLVAAAKACLGQNLSLGTGVPPEVACAVSVNLVHQKAFGVPIGGGASTQALYQVLLKHPDFKEISQEKPGCIVISPTGYGSKPQYPHGHVAISGHYGLCSNDSATGIFSENYTWDSWRKQFQDVEGFPVYVFERL